MKKNQALESVPVWNEALDLVKSIYVLTVVFPDEEKQLLSKQLKESAVKVSNGIAKALSTQIENRQQFLQDAILSIVEIETMLQIALKLNYLNPSDIETHCTKCENIQMHINALIHKLNKIT